MEFIKPKSQPLRSLCCDRDTTTNSEYIMRFCGIIWEFIVISNSSETSGPAASPVLLTIAGVSDHHAAVG